MLLESCPPLIWSRRHAGTLVRGWRSHRTRNSDTTGHHYIIIKTYTASRYRVPHKSRFFSCKESFITDTGTIGTQTNRTRREYHGMTGGRARCLVVFGNGIKVCLASRTAERTRQFVAGGKLQRKLTSIRLKRTSTSKYLPIRYQTKSGSRRHVHPFQEYPRSS